jgi:hypothetical protein
MFILLHFLRYLDERTKLKIVAVVAVILTIIGIGCSFRPGTTIARSARLGSDDHRASGAFTRLDAGRTSLGLRKATVPKFTNCGPTAKHSSRVSSLRTIRANESFT